MIITDWFDWYGNKQIFFFDFNKKCSNDWFDDFDFCFDVWLYLSLEVTPIRPNSSFHSTRECRDSQWWIHWVCGVELRFLRVVWLFPEVECFRLVTFAGYGLCSLGCDRWSFCGRAETWLCISLFRFVQVSHFGSGVTWHMFGEVCFQLSAFVYQGAG